MKKNIFTFIIIVSFVTSVSILFLSDKKTYLQNKRINEQVEEIFNEMTIEEKIGQMIIISNRSLVMNDELKDTITKVKPGGFIFFSENFERFEQSKKLITDLKSLTDTPLFLSIDQEGGIVQRLKNMPDLEITTIPNMSEVGKKNDENYAYEVGSRIAKDLTKLEINMNFAPVLDIKYNEENNITKDRSFGSTTEIVTKLGLSLAKGLEENGVIPVYKHFPGHGSTTIDSHKDLPLITKTKEELEKSDLIPFKEAIKRKAKVIMVGHLAVPSITLDNTPASLSKNLIKDYLKEELQYNGLVMTDALNMKALTKYYTELEIVEKAIYAGVDILLMPPDPVNTINCIKELIRNDKVLEKQINNSVKSILKLKIEMGIII